MKKLILLLSILIPSLSWGQFDVSMNGGYLASVPIAGKDVSSFYKGDMHPYFSIGGLYQKNNFVYGLSVDIYSVGTKSDISSRGDDKVTEHSISSYYGISPNISVGYHLLKGFNVGLRAGMYLSKNSKVRYSLSGYFEKEKDNYETEKLEKDKMNIYYSYGIYASYDINIFKGFSIVPELSPHFITLTQKSSWWRDFYNGKTYLVIPLSIGIKYSF